VVAAYEKAYEKNAYHLEDAVTVQDMHRKHHYILSML
jgi:hypothetical protein